MTSRIRHPKSHSEVSLSDARPGAKRAAARADRRIPLGAFCDDFSAGDDWMDELDAHMDATDPG